jgi:hypothetical protein
VPLEVVSAANVETIFAMFGTRVTFNGPCMLVGNAVPTTDGTFFDMIARQASGNVNSIEFLSGNPDATEITFPPGYDSVRSTTGGLIVPGTYPVTPI